jgi:hypothetical protein
MAVTEDLIHVHRLGLLLFLLASGGSSLARLSHSVINSSGKKILFPLWYNSQEYNPNKQDLPFLNV